STGGRTRSLHAADCRELSVSIAILLSHLSNGPHRPVPAIYSVSDCYCRVVPGRGEPLSDPGAEGPSGRTAGATASDGRPCRTRRRPPSSRLTDIRVACR